MNSQERDQYTLASQSLPSLRFCAAVLTTIVITFSASCCHARRDQNRAGREVVALSPERGRDVAFYALTIMRTRETIGMSSLCFPA